ncbi:hypothetical protein VNO78_07487 [Psophocarpus tetragonolobus]|uniref:Pectinesterase inhibitor domain-containing protein n=1 Tax=Psophocarpus tetragonolobus TaxID=3891 RepID=A0AAN9SW86_PSOTE
MLHSFLVKSTSHIERAVSITNATRLKFNGPGEEVSLDECVELMNLSKERIWNSLVALKEKSTESMQDAHTWLSSVLTNYQTCLDDLQGRPHELLEVELQNLISRARTSLAMLVAILPPKVENIIDKNLKTVNGNFPSWVTSKDRRLLESTARDIKANVVVADDGTGNFKTVKEAVASVPKNSKTRYVIYVKAGLYREIVEISSNKRNVMLVGDGMEETIITGGLNYKDIKNTFRTATVEAYDVSTNVYFKNFLYPLLQLPLGMDSWLKTFSSITAQGQRSTRLWPSELELTNLS